MKNNRRLRLQHYIDTQCAGERAVLIARTGLTKGRIAQLLDPEETFGEKAARNLEDKLGLPSGWLDRSQADDDIKAREPKAPYGLPADKYVTVQKLENGLGLGYVELSEFDEVDGRHAFRRDWIIKNGWNVEHLRVLDARGDSQKPYINDGDVVLVNTAAKRIIDGEFYALRTEDGATIKRCFRQMDGKVRLEALNAPVDYLSPDRPGEIMGQIVYRAG